MLHWCCEFKSYKSSHLLLLFVFRICITSVRLKCIKLLWQYHYHGGGCQAVSFILYIYTNFICTYVLATLACQSNHWASLIAAFMSSCVPFRYPKRRFIVRSREVSKPRDRTNLNTNLAAPRLCEILRWDVLSEIKTAPRQKISRQLLSAINFQHWAW